jgi:hypothetical protein
LTAYPRKKTRGGVGDPGHAICQREETFVTPESGEHNHVLVRCGGQPGEVYR